ncbi:hypothetical protein B0A49_10733 [Cryomyces minteri]|uniref:Uncharacterized protein n=1 Tax=Cryomyces minteri TaxID=331657 RepID=A0A4U0X0J2_9PEZI|nr:hypothetical protein B0A49_10733 [Cryomyces minteri]
MAPTTIATPALNRRGQNVYGCTLQRGQNVYGCTVQHSELINEHKMTDPLGNGKTVVGFGCSFIAERTSPSLLPVLATSRGWAPGGPFSTRRGPAPTALRILEIPVV